MTDQLFDIPATHRPALDVWKERHGVWTHYSDMGRDADNWIACAAVDFIREFKVEKEDAENIGSLFAAWCRIIDEAGYVASGDTEQDACFKLSELRVWPFLESVSEQDRRLK